VFNGRSGLVKGMDKVGEIAEEDVNIMMTTNVIGLIGVLRLHPRSRVTPLTPQGS